jgi:DNA-binding IclR family transcriptional regulator
VAKDPVDASDDGAGGNRRSAAPAVDRALDIIELLAVDPEARGINELARELAIPVNSVYRVLQRLVDRGYASADGDGHRLTSRLYSLGLSLAARFDLRGRSRPHLEELARRTGQTCQLHVWDGGRMLAAECVAPESDYWLAVRPGARLLVTCNAFGKAVLPFLEDAEREAVLTPPLETPTARSPADPAVLAAELDAVAATGIAWDHEEYVPGIFCVGAPVFGVDGRVLAGIGVSGFAGALGDDPRRFELPVLETAAAVAADIGYAGEAYRTWLAQL